MVLVPGLINVCVFFVFIISIFGILGINTFRGAQYNFCRATDTIIDDGMSDPYWPINEDATWLCSTDDNCSGFPNNLGDDVIAKCGSVFEDFGLDSRAVDSSHQIPLIFFDTFNFNNIFKSCLLIFQVITLEGWTSILYNYMDSASRFGAFIFFTMIVIFGSFVTLNLFLAEVMHSFLEAEERVNQQEINEKQKREKKGKPSKAEKKKAFVDQSSISLSEKPGNSQSAEDPQTEE